MRKVRGRLGLLGAIGSMALIVVMMGSLVLTKSGSEPVRGGVANSLHATATTGGASPSATAEGTSATATPTPRSGQRGCSYTDTCNGGAGSSGGSGGNATPTAAPTATSTPLPVVSVALSTPSSGFDGTCQDQITLPMTITLTVAPHSDREQVDYTWVSFWGIDTANHFSFDFFPGDTSATIQTAQPLPASDGNGGTYWWQIEVTSPQQVFSQKVDYTLTCVRTITSMTASVAPTSWDAPCTTVNQSFNFTFTITTTPGPPMQLTYQPVTSGGFREWYPANSVNLSNGTFTINRTGTLYFDTEPGGGDGTFWEELKVTAPVSMTSNQATITKNC